MDIVRFKGGLGNQMFQYAFMEALRHRGREVHASLGFYQNKWSRKFILTDVFPNAWVVEVEDGIFRQIDRKWQDIKKDSGCLEQFKNNLEERFFYVEEQDGFFDKRVFQTRNCTFVGYWQTEKYFRDIKGELMDKFSFLVKEDALRKLGDKLQNNIFSIHVRQGDYQEDYFRKIYGGICTGQYYRKAVEYIKEKVPDARFLLFSDEMERVCMEYAGREDFIVFDKEMFRDYQDWYDMYLMSKCRGNIIANSSFSWWGAWLNRHPNKVVVAPKLWLNGIQTPDIWCDGWVRM